MLKWMPEYRVKNRAFTRSILWLAFRQKQQIKFKIGPPQSNRSDSLRETINICDKIAVARLETTVLLSFLFLWTQ